MQRSHICFEIQEVLEIHGDKNIKQPRASSICFIFCYIFFVFQKSYNNTKSYKKTYKNLQKVTKSYKKLQKLTKTYQKTYKYLPTKLKKVKKTYVNFFITIYNSSMISVSDNY